MEWLWLAAFWLEAPDVGRCASISCKCIVSPTAVRLLPGEGAKEATSCLIGLRASDLGVVMRSTSELPIMLGP